MNYPGVIASLGKGLTDFGVNPDETARLMHGLSQKLKLGFADGARIAILGLRSGAGGAIFESVNTQFIG